MKAFYIFGFCLLLQGCAVFNGRPESVIDVDKTLERYTTKLAELADNPPTKCSDVKAGIDRALTAMDLRYSAFVDDISVEGKSKTTITDFALIGLGLAGTAVGGAPAKTVLHAISTGFAGANTAIDKNFFYEKSIDALVSQMNADRKEKLSVIVQRYAKCDETNYSWFEAVHDLNDYYSAGTLLGALTSISKNAGTREGVAEAEIKDTLKLTISENTDDKQYLRNELHKHGDKTIMQCWAEANPELFDSPKPSDIKCGIPNAAKLINAKECQEYQANVRACVVKKNTSTNQ